MVYNFLKQFTNDKTKNLKIDKIEAVETKPINKNLVALKQDFKPKFHGSSDNLMVGL